MIPEDRRIPVLVLTALVIAIFVLHLPARDQRYVPPDPHPYWDTITHWGHIYEVDPLLVAAVIKNESAFDPRRLSPEGAVGLMQILPSTAELVAADLQLDGVTHEHLYDPSMNIRFGTYYLAQLLDDFAGDEVAALAAYNAGPGRVSRWQQTEQWSNNSGLNRIPLMETRSYVLLVLRDYERFSERLAD